MMDLTTSIIILNINILNISTKKQRLSGYFFKVRTILILHYNLTYDLEHCAVTQMSYLDILDILGLLLWHVMCVWLALSIRLIFSMTAIKLCCVLYSIPHELWNFPLWLVRIGDIPAPLSSRQYLSLTLLLIVLPTALDNFLTHLPWSKF